MLNLHIDLPFVEFGINAVQLAHLPSITVLLVWTLVLAFGIAMGARIFLELKIVLFGSPFPHPLLHFGSSIVKLPSSQQRVQWLPFRKSCWKTLQSFTFGWQVLFMWVLAVAGTPASPTKPLPLGVTLALADPTSLVQPRLKYCRSLSNRKVQHLLNLTNAEVPNSWVITDISPATLRGQKKVISLHFPGFCSY